MANVGIVGFDMDGVLYNWHVSAWEWYRDNVDDDITFNEFWDVPNGWIDKNEGGIMIHNIVSDLTLFTKNTAKPSIVDAVNRINNISNDIYYITARPTAAKSLTAKWLRENGFPKVENLIFSDEYGGKPVVVKETGCKYYIEDRTNNILELMDITTVFAVTTPYNKNYDFGNRVIRVDDVIDVANILERV